MSRSLPGPVRQLLGGGSMVMGADALQLPTGLLLAAYLSRALGVEGLGIYLLAAAVILFIEIVIGSLTSRAAVQLIAESRSWEAVASMVLRWNTVIGGTVTLLLWGFLLPVDTLFGVAGLKECLLLFSLEIPLSSLARAHTHVLVGLGRFRERAWCSAARWVGRLVLAVSLVEAGLSVYGAVLGAVGSTAIGFLVARRFVKVRWGVASIPGLRRRLFRYSLPLFLHSMALQLFHRMGLLVLVPLGVGLGVVGLYGAADSLMRLRRLLGQSLTPLFLSTLTRMLRDGLEAEARRLTQNALRVVLLTVVPVAAVAGAAPEIMAWLFGSEFAAGGSLLMVLILSAPSFLVISVVTAVLIARARPATPFRLTVPVLLAAFVGYLVGVPRWGAPAAAAVTTTSGWLMALAFLGVLYDVWRVAPPLWTTLRVALAGGVVFAGARLFAPEGAWLILGLPGLALAGAVVLLATGELGRSELALLGRWARGEGSKLPEGVRGDLDQPSGAVSPQAPHHHPADGEG